MLVQRFCMLLQPPMWQSCWVEQQELDSENYFLNKLEFSKKRKKRKDFLKIFLIIFMILFLHCRNGKQERKRKRDKLTNVVLLRTKEAARVYLILCSEFESPSCSLLKNRFC